LEEASELIVGPFIVDGCIVKKQSLIASEILQSVQDQLKPQIDAYIKEAEASGEEAETSGPDDTDADTSRKTSGSESRRKQSQQERIVTRCSRERG